MWCLETIVQINDEQAKGKNTFDAYEACGIKVLGNTKRIENGTHSDPAVPIGDVGLHPIIDWWFHQ